MKFTSRHDAGEKLAAFLKKRDVDADIVLGLPRGGVVVAAEVARELKLPLDVLVVRKIGHPLQPEFAIGAIAEPDSIFLREESLREFPVAGAELNKVIAAEKNRLRDYRRRFHLSPIPQIGGRNVLLVDDGLATGATAEVAVISLRKQNVRRIVVAAPVASVEAVERLRRLADQVEVLGADPDFMAVGQFYEEFPQASDDEVVKLLRAAGQNS